MRTGVRALFMVRVVGSACAIRRSPHSLAAASPSATVRQRDRSTVLPAFTAAVATSGACCVDTLAVTLIVPAAFAHTCAARRERVPGPRRRDGIGNRCPLTLTLALALALPLAVAPIRGRPSYMKRRPGALALVVASVALS